MMTYCSTSKEKTKTHGEVFTPAGTVFKMLTRKEARPSVIDVNKPIFDPAVGEGQFPCAELVLRMFYNVERLDEELVLTALKNLYGMDIQSVSVDKARAHMLATTCDAYKFFTGKEISNLNGAIFAILGNFVCGDSLKLMQDLAKPQLSLF